MNDRFVIDVSQGDAHICHVLGRAQACLYGNGCRHTTRVDTVEEDESCSAVSWGVTRKKRRKSELPEGVLTPLGLVVFLYVIVLTMATIWTPDLSFGHPVWVTAVDGQAA